MSKDKSDGPPTPTPFQRFEDLARSLFAVPKEEVEKKRQEQAKQKQEPKSNPRPKKN